MRQPAQTYYIIDPQTGQPAIFYIHPWEIDPEQPRLQGSLPTRFRHYNQLARTEDRLRRLLRDFRFGSIESVVLIAPRPAGARREARQ